VQGKLTSHGMQLLSLFLEVTLSSQLFFQHLFFAGRFLLLLVELLAKGVYFPLSIPIFGHI